MPCVPILLVDDLEENLLSLEALLRGEDRLLLKACSGDQALELLLKHDVVLALVDVQMPGLNGFELAELMRGSERTRRIPIMFVTAGMAGGRRFRGYEAGAVDFIQKPIEPDVLQSKVDVFVELYQQRQQLADQRDALAAQRDELTVQAEALKEAARHKDLLLHEINHRRKNLFSLTSSLISLSARPARNVMELEKDLKSRITAFARAHELTLPDLNLGSDPSETTTTVSALLKAIVAPHEHAQGPRAVIGGTDVRLDGTALTSLALLLHELTTNAAKYGGLSIPEGRITIDLEIAEEMLHLKWDESGVAGLAPAFERPGFGTRLEQATLAGLNGEIKRDWKNDGLLISLRIPLSKLAS